MTTETATLAAIADRVTDRAGLRPPGWILEARVRDRLGALGLTRPSEYLHQLDEAELERLIEALRVGETRFFRHRAQVAALERLVIPELAQTHAAVRRVRAWSAGCATGEEAYTVAMVLANALPGWDFEVLGTDLSDEALTRARAGVYAEAVLEPVPPALRSRWFRPAGNGRAVVVPELAERVRFERRNLLDVFAGEKDLILCRNVLIYFDSTQRAATARRLSAALADGGFLFVGYAETLRTVAGLEAVRTEDGVVYRKTARRMHPAEPPSTVVPIPVAAATTESTSAPSHGVTTVCIVGSHDSAERIAGELRAAIGRAHRGVVVELDGADYLADEVAAVFRRARAAARAAGLAFALRAERPGPRRFLTRHGLHDEDAP